MQPDRARTSCLGVPLPPLARRVCWVAPVRPTLRVQTVASCPFADLDACACALCWRTWRLFTGVHTLCVSCMVFAATWLLSTGACAVCGMRLLVRFCPPSPPPFFACSILVFFQIEEGARAHCRHRPGQLMQRCSSVAFTGVRRRCFIGGFTPGVQLTCFDVHSCGSEWVWFVVSLRFGAGWLGGRMGCGCGLWLLCTVGGLG